VAIAVAAAYGIGKHTAYELIRKGRLAVRCVGKRGRIVLYEDAERCMAELPRVELSLPDRAANTSAGSDDPSITAAALERAA
jgi:hypothetical protein